MYQYLLGLTLLAVSTYSAASTAVIKYDSLQDGIESTVLVKNGSSYENVSGKFGSYNLKEQYVNGTFIGFCVEPLQSASSSFYTYTESALSNVISGSKLQNVQKLFDNAYAGVVGNDIKSAGFHLALWEIFLDDKNVNSGIIKVDNSGSYQTNNSMESYAASLLASLNNWDVKNLFELTLYSNSHKQDYIGFTPVSPVPVPAALPLLASSLVGLGFMRRRKSA